MGRESGGDGEAGAGVLVESRSLAASPGNIFLTCSIICCMKKDSIRFPSLVTAQINLVRAGNDDVIDEVAADQGHHANQTLTDCQSPGGRSYIPKGQSGSTPTVTRTESAASSWSTVTRPPSGFSNRLTSPHLQAEFDDRQWWTGKPAA